MIALRGQSRVLRHGNKKDVFHHAIFFNAVELCILTINEKPWTRPREVCKGLEHNKKTADIVKAFCSQKNYAHKWQLNKFATARNFMDWPKDLRKDDYYINEEGMYELLFSSQQPKAKDFRRHCFNVLFPHVRQQLSDKLHAMQIEDLTSRVQALEFTNEEECQANQQQILKLIEDHQQAIEEKDATIALLNDDLKNREHENVALQAQRDVYQAQVRDLIINRHVPRAKHPGKDNIVMIIEKNTTPEKDEFYEYLYYIARIQRRFINTKR